MINPHLYLITNSFSIYTGKTDYVVLRLCKNSLQMIFSDLPLLASKIQNMGGGSASSVNVNLGHVTLISEPLNSDTYNIFSRFDKAIRDGDGETVLDTIKNNAEDLRIGLDGFSQTIMTEPRDRMILEFSEIFGDQVTCSDALIPTRLRAFYQNSADQLRENSIKKLFCTQMGEWLAIVA